jgi:hypothetical protein
MGKKRVRVETQNFISKIFSNFSKKFLLNHQKAGAI